MGVQGVPLLGGRNSANTSLAGVGDLMDADGYVVSSETASTSYGSISCAALGEVGTPQQFAWTAGNSFLFSGRLLLRLPWTLTTQTATATARATLRAKLYIAGVLIASGDGAPRNINSTNGTKFAELISLSVTTPVLIPAGGVILLTITELITTVAAAGQVYTATLRHDPQTVDDQLVAEFGGAR